MVGIELPILAMETSISHHRRTCRKLVGKTRANCMPSIFEGEIYIRQRAWGACSWEPTKRAGVPWSETNGHRGTLGQDLLPNDLERIAPSFGNRFSSIFPALGNCGHQKKLSTVPLRFAPDGNPLIGTRPRGSRIFWVAMRGHGRFQPRRRRRPSRCPHWMVDGDSGRGTCGVWDVARYGDWTTLGLYQCESARETTRGVFSIRFSERGIKRRRDRLRTTTDLRPTRARTRGVRRLLWPGTRVYGFAPSAAQAKDEVSFPTLQLSSLHRGRVCSGGAIAVGFVSRYRATAKFEVQGVGAADWFIGASWRIAYRSPVRIALSTHAQ